MGKVQEHADTPPIPLTKIKNDDKSDKYSVKIELHRDPASENSDLYEFKMALCDNGDPEEFLLFIQNFNMALKASKTLKAGVNIQYLPTLVRGEALRQFDTSFSEVVSSSPENMTSNILGLGMYYFPVNLLSKQKRVMRR